MRTPKDCGIAGTGDLRYVIRYQLDGEMANDKYSIKCSRRITRVAVIMT
jgi:hypothetical protein